MPPFCECRNYQRMFMGCHHLITRHISCRQLHHHHVQPAAEIKLDGLCEVCITERDICNATLNPEDASHIAEFARAFYDFHEAIERERSIASLLRGLVNREDCDFLHMIWYALQKDIVWRGRWGRTSDLPTLEERQIVADLGILSFNGIVRGLESQHPDIIARWHRHHIIPCASTDENTSCMICYDDYGSTDEDGNLAQSIRWSCGHVGCCSTCAPKILNNNNGCVDGSQCPYRCPLLSMPQIENRLNGDEEPTEFLEQLEALMDVFEEAFEDPVDEFDFFAAAAGAGVGNGVHHGSDEDEDEEDDEFDSDDEGSLVGYEIRQTTEVTSMTMLESDDRLWKGSSSARLIYKN